MSIRPLHGIVPLLLAIGPATAFAAKEGILWEETVEMSSQGGYAMPPQTRKACRSASPGEWSKPPGGEKDQDCKVTEFKRSGSKMTWKVVCERERISGEGEMTYTADSYAGKVTMRSAEQGTFAMKIRGRKLGGPCDPGQEQRELEERRQHATAMQGQQAQAMVALCDGAVQNLDFNMLTNLPNCKARIPDACARLQTPEGFEQASRSGPMNEKAAEATCGLKMADIRPALCRKAPGALRTDAPRDDAANQRLFRFIAGQCPAERQALAQKECAGRSWTGKNVPAAWIIDFCVSYAREELTGGSRSESGATDAKPAPTDAPKSDALEGAKKAAKGLLGF